MFYNSIANYGKRSSECSIWLKNSLNSQDPWGTKKVQDYLVEKFTNYTDELKITNIGNLLPHFPGEGKKILINAHADEIGYVVQNITDDGFLKVIQHDPRHQPSDRIIYPYCTVG